jgi:PRTRC genetic system ThiF family protein
MKLPTIFSLEGYYPTQNILIIGCGGTGAYVTGHLSKIISTMSVKPELILADGDAVEEKNLLRQHFTNSDITKNKALVLAERYSAAFGLNITAYPKDLESYYDIIELLPTKSNKINIVIGCVDNNATRKIINEWFLSQRQAFWIDSGNEEKNGQVICGYKIYQYSSGTSRLNVKNKCLNGEFSLPTVIELYPEILQSKEKFNSELSCAERAISSPQNMQTNVTAATLVLNYVQKILFREPIRSHGVEFNIDNVFSIKHNTKENLSKINNSRLTSWEFAGI